MVDYGAGRRHLTIYLGIFVSDVADDVTLLPKILVGLVVGVDGLFSHIRNALQLVVLAVELVFLAE